METWKWRVVNKYHQQLCCGQKCVCMYVVEGLVGINDIYYFIFDISKFIISVLHNIRNRYIGKTKNNVI